MKRTASALVVIGILLLTAVISEVQMGGVPREDPLGRDLLYLPSPEVLKLVSLGNPGLVADVLYLWSIQYYSRFRPEERFLYLETIYDLITDLDPLYFDAYRIGALIMQIQTGGDPDQLKMAVRRLFDKGLRNLPQSWMLAEAAAWDMFIRFRDRGAALHYAEIAAERPGAPARLKRIVGVWRDTENVWTVDDSIDYWRKAVAEAEDAYDRRMCMSHLFDATVLKDRQLLDRLLREHAAISGACAESWEEMIAAGLLHQVPADLTGSPYGIEPENCVIVAYKRIKDQ